MNSPAYLSVTQRLYQKHPAVRREEELMCLSGSTYPASSQMQQELPALSSRNGFLMTINHQKNRSLFSKKVDIPRKNFLDIESPSHKMNNTEHKTSLSLRAKLKDTQMMMFSTMSKTIFSCPAQQRKEYHILVE